MDTNAMDQINTSFYQQQNYGYPNAATDEVWYVDIGKEKSITKRCMTTDITHSY
jgi:hypothetical protein